ncbi:hypothetical protein C8R45DRAFT_883515 [Mycena sanguinolenta]|nr:hypothetical protein C8R45DRAFT_883515 [Mycena sanguinolenta]
MEAEANSVVENLNYLSKYLEDSNARVTELENELANTGQENHDMNSRILTLESQNAELRTHVSSLRDRLKVTHERLETTLKVKQEDQEDFALKEAKYTHLQAHLKDTAELAAKALRQQTQMEKALEKSRQECSGLQATNEALLTEVNSYAHLKLKYDKLKKGTKELRNDKEELQQVVDNLSRQCNETKEARGHLEEKCALLETRIAKLDEEIEAETEVERKYWHYMSDLPMPERPPPPWSTLEAVCHKNTNLHAYLSRDPTAGLFLNHVLYLPQRVLRLPGHDFLAYGPTGRYNRAANAWIEGSDLVDFHGGTRELFIERENTITYVGTYKCHDLRTLQPVATNSPTVISPKEIMNVALGLLLPENHREVIEERYPDGKIKMDVTGLQCIGFNTELYDAMRKRYANGRKDQKRKAGDEDIKDGETKKQRKKRKKEKSIADVSPE